MRWTISPWLTGAIVGFVFWQFLLPQRPAGVFKSSPLPRYSSSLAGGGKRTPGDKVLCWMPVFQLADNTRQAILNTWAARCDKFYFVAKEGTLAEQTIAHNYERFDRFDLWNQVHRGWTRIAEMHMEEYDWFVKLDADSYFDAANLRALVHEKNWTSHMILYLGNTIFEQSRPISEVRAQFNLGAGYAVSKKLLSLIYPYFYTAVRSNLTEEQRCPEWQRWGEDVKFADCLRILYPTLLPNASQDAFGRETFFPFSPNTHLLQDEPPWYFRGKNMSAIRQQFKRRCCSSRPVLWHGFGSPMDVFAVDYLQYLVAVDPNPLVMA